MTIPPTIREIMAIPPATAPNELVMVLKNPTSVLLIVEFEVVGRTRCVVPLRPHQHSHLVGGVFQNRARSAGLDVHRERLCCAVALLVGGQRHRHPVVLARAKGAALLLADSYDGVRRPIDPQLLTDWIDSREKMVLNVGSDDGDVRGVFLIGVRKTAALLDI